MNRIFSTSILLMLIALHCLAQERHQTFQAGVQTFRSGDYKAALALFNRGIEEYKDKTKDSIYVEHLHYKYLCESWLEMWDESKKTKKLAVNEYEKLGHPDDFLGCVLARDYTETIYDDRKEKQEFIRLMKRYVNALDKEMLAPLKYRWVTFYFAGAFRESAYWHNKDRFPSKSNMDEHSIFKKKCLFYAYDEICDAKLNGKATVSQWETVALQYAIYSCQDKSNSLKIIDEVIKSRRNRLTPDKFYLYASAFDALSAFVSDEEFEANVKRESSLASQNTLYGNQLEVYVKYILAYHYDDIEHYKTAVKSFENTNYKGNEKNMYYCIHDLARIFEKEKLYSSAAFYYEKELSLMTKYWKEWEKVSKYSRDYPTDEYGGKPANNSKLELYYDLYSAYRNAKMYSRAIELSKEILNDPELRLDEKEIKGIKENINDCQDHIGSYQKIENTDNPNLNPPNDLSFQSVEEYVKSGDTLQAAKAIKQLIKEGKYFYEPYIDYLYKAGDKQIAKKYIEKYLFEPEIEDYTLSEGFYDGSPVIHMMELLATYYRNDGDYIRELKILKDAWNVCRSDSKSSEENLRLSVNATGIDAIENEVQIMSLLGDYYFRHMEFGQGYEWYKKAFDRTTEFFNVYVTKWSFSTIAEEWDRRNWIFYETEALAPYTEKYPQLSNLILNASTAIKGFHLYLRRDINEGYNSKSPQARKLLDNSLNTEKTIENLFYSKGVSEQNISELEAENDAIKVKATTLLGTTNASFIKSFNFNIKSFANSLLDKEVFVDFFTVFTHTEDSVTIYDDMKLIRRKPVHKIYCSILRKNWTSPHVVELCDDYNVYIDQSNNRLCDYLERNTPEIINRIYTSQPLSDIVWKKILEQGKIKEGESILFIPTGIISELAIESLPCRLGGIMQDHYDLYRFSSVREIKSSPLYCQPNDNCVLIGGLNYGNNLLGNRRSSIDEDTRKTISKGCPKLKGTIEEIDHISKLMAGRCLVFKEDQGTESSFFDMDGKSPSIIHISTHGFSRQYVKEEESEFLLGNRYGRYVGNEEQRMYLTGLYMSPSHIGIPTEGLLTSKEISMTDLSGTKLVVLSACSTGRGLVTDDGVFGLQRGLKMAGVGAILLTFWDVPDQTTTVLMNRFWDLWYSGKYSLKQSLNTAKLELRKKYPEEPYMWNAFVILDGK